MSSEEKDEEPTFTPTRTVTLRCRRAIFGREPAQYFGWNQSRVREQLRVGYQDVSLVVEADSESSCFTFSWEERGILTGALIKGQRVIRGSDVTCVKVHFGEAHLSPAIVLQTSVLWRLRFGADPVDVRSTRFAFEPSTDQIVCLLEPGFDRGALEHLLDSTLHEVRQPLRPEEAHQHFVSIELQVLREREQRLIEREARLKALDAQEASLKLKEASLDRREAKLSEWADELYYDSRMNSEVERMLNDGIGRQLIPDVQRQFIIDYSDGFHRQLLSMKHRTHELMGSRPFHTKSFATQGTQTEDVPAAPVPPAPSIALGKRSSSEVSEETLEPLSRARSQALGRDGARKYLKRMGASTYGVADVLRARILKLFDANGIDTGPDDGTTNKWYHPGITRLAVTKVDET